MKAYQIEIADNTDFEIFCSCLRAACHIIEIAAASTIVRCILVSETAADNDDNEKQRSWCAIEAHMRCAGSVSAALIITRVGRLQFAASQDSMNVQHGQAQINRCAIQY